MADGLRLKLSSSSLPFTTLRKHDKGGKLRAWAAIYMAASTAGGLGEAHSPDPNIPKHAGAANNQPENYLRRRAVFVTVMAKLRLNHFSVPGILLVEMREIKGAWSTSY